MKSYYGKAAAGCKAVKCTVKRFGKFIKFSVHGYSYCLKGFARRMSSVAPCRRRNGAAYNIRKLCGCFNRLSLSCFQNSVNNSGSKFFFAIVIKYFCKLRPGSVVYQIICRKPLFAHTHIKGRFAVIAEPPFGIVKLVRTYAKVKQHTINLFYSKAVKHFWNIRKIRMYNRCAGVFRKPFGCNLYGIRIFVKRNKPAGGKAFCNFSGVARSAGGAVNIYSIRLYFKAVYAFFKQYGNMMKIHIAHTAPQKPSSSIASAMASESIELLLAIQLSLFHISTWSEAPITAISLVSPAWARNVGLTKTLPCLSELTTVALENIKRLRSLAFA